jgi:hypothetical protein
MDRRRQPAVTTGPGVVFVGQIAARLPMIDVACNRCDRRGRLSTARPVAQYGADMPGPELLRLLSADCPRRIAGQWHDVCGIHMPQMAELDL